MPAGARMSLTAQFTQASSQQASPTRSAAAAQSQQGSEQQAAGAPGEKRSRGPHVLSPGRAKSVRVAAATPVQMRSAATQAAVNQIQRAKGVHVHSARALAVARREMVKAAAAAGRRVLPSDLLLCSDSKIRETSRGPEGHRTVLQERRVASWRQPPPRP